MDTPSPMTVMANAVDTTCGEIDKLRAERDDLRKALLAACNYIENATLNLGRKASANYSRAATTYRMIAAGEMKFSDIRDR